MIAAGEPSPPRAPVGALRELLRRDGWPSLAAALATMAVELGVFLGALACGADGRQSAIASLAAGVVWVSLAAPALAAGSNSGLGALLRGGIVADASAVLLIVLWLATPQVSFLAAVKIYCIYAALALAGSAAVRCARAPAPRFALAAVASIVFITALASPFWAGGALVAAHASGSAITNSVFFVSAAASPSWPASALLATGEIDSVIVASTVVCANPFYCIWSVLADQMPYAWHQAPVIYRITYLGNYAAVPAAPWYAAVIIYIYVAGILAATNLLRRDRGYRISAT